MTNERAREIERKVFYKHFDNIMRDLGECEDPNIIFNVGRYIGMMQDALNDELDKEVELPGFGNAKFIDA